MSSEQEIHIAAALISREDGKIVLVRKRGTLAFMQPGGKIEAHERPVQALCRELREELDLAIEEDQPEYLGRFQAPAANEPGCLVVAELFRLSISSAVAPAAELEEIAWIDPANPGEICLAPLTRDCVLGLVGEATSLYPLNRS